MPHINPDARLMSDMLYRIQYFFESTCEYAYDQHPGNCTELLKRAFPDNTADVDIKIAEIRKGNRIREKFTAKDKEMERILKGYLFRGW